MDGRLVFIFDIPFVLLLRWRLDCVAWRASTCLSYGGGWALGRDEVMLLGFTELLLRRRIWRVR